MVATSCDLNAPRCTTKAQQVRLHGSRGCVFIGHRRPRDLGIIRVAGEVLRLFRRYTRTPCLWQVGVHWTHEVKMRMKREMRMR